MNPSWNGYQDCVPVRSPGRPARPEPIRAGADGQHRATSQTERSPGRVVRLEQGDPFVHTFGRTPTRRKVFSGSLPERGVVVDDPLPLDPRPIASRQVAKCGDHIGAALLGEEPERQAL